MKFVKSSNFGEIKRTFKTCQKISSILKDEVKHLQEMSEKAQTLFGEQWVAIFDKAFEAESNYFVDWAQSIRDAACLTTNSL